MCRENWGCYVMMRIKVKNVGKKGGGWDDGWSWAVSVVQKREKGNKKRCMIGQEG